MKRTALWEATQTASKTRHESKQERIASSRKFALIGAKAAAEQEAVDEFFGGEPQEDQTSVQKTEVDKHGNILRVKK